MKLSDTSQHDRFLCLLVLFVSDSTCKIFTCSPFFFFKSMSVRDLCQPGVCCSELSVDNTYHNGILTCDWQLLWQYVCLLWGYNKFPNRDFLRFSVQDWVPVPNANSLSTNSNQVFNKYSFHMGNVIILNMVDFWMCCWWTLLSHISMYKGNRGAALS